MKTPNISNCIKILALSVIFHFSFCILNCPAGPTNNPAPATIGVVTDTNGNLLAPANLFTQNLPLLNAAGIAASTATDTNALHATNNLSDVANVATARANLGLGTAATSAAAAFQPASAALTNLSANNAAGLTNVQSSSLAGTLQAAQFPATLPAASGANLTSLPAANLSGTVSVANGGTGASTARGVGANIGTYQASPTSGNDAFADIAAAIPIFIGQSAISSYNPWFPFHWVAISTSGSGQTNWTGSAAFAGKIAVGDVTHMNPNTDIGENSFIANGVAAPSGLSSPADNVLSLKNQHSSHYSAMRWLSCDGDGLGERGAIGYGNSTSLYKAVDYLEDYGGASGFYFTASGFVEGGMEKATQNFVWYKSFNSGTNVQASNVVFRVDQSGNVSLAGSLTATSNFRTIGTAEVNGNLTVDTGYVHLPSSYIHSYGVNGGVTAMSDSSNVDTMFLGDDGLTLLSGGIQTALASKSSSYAIAVIDSTILVTATGQTITLPNANSGLNNGTGHIYTVKLTHSGTCTITNATGAQTIDGALSYTLSAQYKYVTVQSDGANWNVIGNN
jgi:hypothetical protein